MPIPSLDVSPSKSVWFQKFNIMNVSYIKEKIKQNNDENESGCLREASLIIVYHPGQKYSREQFGIIIVDMGYFLGPNWNLCIT